MMRAGNRPPAEFTLMLIGCTLAVINFGLGWSLFFGMPSRTAGVSFNPVRDLAPIHEWGLTYMACGLSILVAYFLRRMSWVGIAHLFAGIMSLFWSIAFVTGLDNPNASATGIWVYLGMGLTHLYLFAYAHLESRWQRGV